MDTVSEALEKTVRSNASLANDAHAAIVSLCRLLASQIDEAGPEASSRLTAAYLSALKDLARATGSSTSGAAGTPKGAGGGGALGKLQGIKGGKSA